MYLVHAKALINRRNVFLAALFLSFLNPITILWMGTSWTFTFAVLFTFFVWFIIKWEDFSRIESKGTWLEVILGASIIIVNITRNLLNASSFGIFDMLVMLIGLYMIFFGLKTTKFFMPLILYALILIVGYQIEFSLEQVKVLQDFLAEIMNSLLKGLNITSWISGDVVIMIDRTGETYSLLIDAPCTGIKGMLAYGSLAVLLVLDIKSPPRKKAIATAVGLIGTFLVNMLRLSVVFLSIYFLGIDVGMFIHTYLGYGLFAIWVVFFWSMAFKHLAPESPKDLPTKTTGSS